MKEIKIKTAQTEDIPALSNLLTILFSQEKDFTPNEEKQKKALTTIINAPQFGTILKAEIDGEIVGMVNLLYTISTAEGEKVILLEDMIVAPPHRGTGVGSALITHATYHAKKIGATRITLLTDAANNEAMEFYKKHEFEKSAMVPFRKKIK